MQGAIHEVTIRKRTPGGATTDSEGRNIESVIEYQQIGRMCILSAQEAADVGRFGENIVAVFLAPQAATITDEDQLIAVDIDPNLDGVYEISAVRFTPAHLRVLLRRSQ
jgi:hypothetical protein